MNGQKKRVAFLTLGCKVNSYETNAMERLFLEADYQVVDFWEASDIYIINTCTVTNMADRKSRQMIHRARKLNQEGIVVAVGCYVQAAKEQLEEDKTIDIVIGNNQKNKIVEVVEDYIEKRKSMLEEQVRNRIEYNVVDIKTQKEYEPLSIHSTGEKTRAYIKVQDGCNQYCSYCIIPYARGPVRSRKLEEIEQEVRYLVNHGYQEVVLTGIHLSSYGVDLEPWKETSHFLNFLELKGEPLLKIIEVLSDMDGLERIRLGSLEPRIITEEFTRKLAQFKKVCPHFHLSLQSGCDDTLKRMNRRYTTDEYLEKCNLLRRYFERPAITTDIIVGFPGETEEEFDSTKRFLEKVAFAQMHVFKYSKRKGTKAAEMPQQVDDMRKSKRSDALLDLEKQMRKQYQNEFINTKQRVLLEEKIVWQEKEYWVGHNEWYQKLAIEADSMEKQYENQMVSVLVEQELGDNMLFCQRIE